MVQRKLAKNDNGRSRLRSGIDRVRPNSGPCQNSLLPAPCSLLLPNRLEQEIVDLDRSALLQEIDANEKSGLTATDQDRSFQTHQRPVLDSDTGAACQAALDGQRCICRDQSLDLPQIAT